MSRSSNYQEEVAMADTLNWASSRQLVSPVLKVYCNRPFPLCVSHCLHLQIERVGLPWKNLNSQEGIFEL